MSAAPPAAVSAELQREVERFLHAEARSLDEGRFGDWLALFAPDGLYWVPSVPGQTDPRGIPSIIYEDTAILAMRVRRLQEARALVMTPMPRSMHLLANIEVTAVSAGAIEAEANFIVAEYRQDRQQLFAGRALYRLKRIADTLRIGLKRVELLDCDGIHGTITVPL